MKNQAVKITAVTAAAISLIAILTIYTAKIPIEKNVRSNLNNITASYSSQNSGFVLKEYDGKIAYFRGDSQTPEEVFDVYVNSLPEQDQKRMKDGIRVQTREELNRLIEDFTS